MSRLCLRNGRVIDPACDADEVRDLWVVDGRIAEDGDTAGAADEEIQANGMLVMPAFVDVHVHLREPGGEDAETVETGCAAALAGGYGAIVAMPNTKPPIDSPRALEAFFETVARVKGPRVAAMPCLTARRSGERLSEMGAMIERFGDRIVGFTDDGAGLQDERLARAAMIFCAEHGTAYVEHCEVDRLSAGGVMHEGPAAARLGLKGYPAEAETAMIERDIRLARETGAHVHFQHLSAEHSVDRVAEAKAEGLRITAEVTPHHLLLTDESAAAGGANFKMNPPLRSERDRRALVEGLRLGIIDMIATDHAPHPHADKAQPFSEAPNGVIGMETAAAVVWSMLVREEALRPKQMAERMATAPGRVFCMGPVDLRPGRPCNAVVFDPNRVWRVDPGRFKSKSRNCPFAGRTIEGRVAWTLVNGEVLYRADTD